MIELIQINDNKRLYIADNVHDANEFGKLFDCLLIRSRSHKYFPYTLYYIVL